MKSSAHVARVDFRGGLEEDVKPMSVIDTLRVPPPTAATLALDHRDIVRAKVRHVDRIRPEINRNAHWIRPHANGGGDGVGGTINHRDAIRAVVRYVDGVRPGINRDVKGLRTHVYGGGDSIGGTINHGDTVRQ